MFSFLGEVLARVLAVLGLKWILSKRKEAQAKASLVDGSLAPKLDLSAIVREKIGALATAGTSQEFAKPAIRAWLSDTATQDAFVRLYESRNSKQAPPADAVDALHASFEHHTGELKRQATPYVDGIYSYLDHSIFGHDGENTLGSAALLRSVYAEVRQPQIEGIDSLLRRARKPALAIIGRGQERWHFPGIHVPVEMEVRGQKSGEAEALQFEQLLRMVLDGTNVLMEGEAGTGKTTAVLALSKSLATSRPKTLPVFIDVATWAATGLPLLDYIAGLPAFLAAGIEKTDLARIREAGKLIVVLNGWNEIRASRRDDTRQLLQESMNGVAPARMIVATRTASDSLGLKSPKRIAVLGFGWEQQQALVRGNLPSPSAQDLVDRLRSDRRLRSLTRNPLILAGVVSLQSSGEPIPDHPFSLFSAIVDQYESDHERSAALKQPPIRNRHRQFATAVASAMNASATTVMAEKESASAVSSVGSSGSDANDVVTELCNRYLLHATDHDSVRFVHQRFQEFFGSLAAFDLLNPTHAVQMQREILNWPFWDDSLHLLEGRLAGDASLIAMRHLLVELAIPVDLALASRIAGGFELGPSDGQIWNDLSAALLALNRNPAPEARRYAIAAMAATRSPQFSDYLWPILESDDQNARLTGFRLAGGVTIDQLGAGAADRILSWPKDRLIEAISELGGTDENFEFILEQAQNHPSEEVRATAVSEVGFLGAADVAIGAWRSAPLSVRESRTALQFVLDYWEPSDAELTEELLKLARESGNASARRSIGLRLLIHGEEIGQEIAREALRASSEKHVDGDLLSFVKSFDPTFVRKLALDALNKRGHADEWIKKEVLDLPAADRIAMAAQALEKIEQGDRWGSKTSLMMAGISEAQVVQLMDEIKPHVDQWATSHNLNEAERLRYGTLDRILHQVPGSTLASLAIERAQSSSYFEIDFYAGILDSQLNESNSDKSVDPPSIEKVRQFIETFKTRRDPRPIPQVGLEAHLASLASKIDAQGYTDLIVEVASIESRAWVTYQTAIDKWAEGGQREERPMNPHNGNHIAQALRRTGFAALDGLFAIADEPGAEHIVPQALATIVASPWFPDKETFSNRNSYIDSHFLRKESKKEFKEPEPQFQPQADRVARLFSERIQPDLALPALLEINSDGRHNYKFFPRAGLAEQLSRVPSEIGKDVLFATLARSDVYGYAYLHIAQNVIRQGALLPESTLPGLRATLEREMAPKWLDQSTRHLVSSLATLHFFVQAQDKGLSQLKDLIPRVTQQCDRWDLIRQLEAIPREEAALLLGELLKEVKDERAKSEYLTNWLAANVRRISPIFVVKLLIGGQFLGLQRDSWRFERDIAKPLANSIAADAAALRMLIEFVDQDPPPADIRTAGHLLFHIAEPQASQALRRLIEGQATKRGNFELTKGLLSHFELASQSDPNQGWYDIHPKAMNDLRSWLFDIAMGSGPIKQSASALLMELEERRDSLGRPGDEPRHPRIDSGVPWPAGLYLLSPG